MTAISSPAVRRADGSWTAVCRLADLDPERGVAVLLGDRQAALFLLHDGSVHAVDNRDPFSGANVMARGIVGTRGDRPTVASPMYKQAFDLRSGACLDDDAAALDVFGVRIRDGLVEVGPPVAPGARDDEAHDDGAHDDGAHDDGVHDDGAHDDGVHDDGALDGDRWTDRGGAP